MSQLTASCLRPNLAPELFCQWHEQPGQRAQLSGAAFLAQVQALATALRTRYPVQSRILLLFEPGLGFPLAFWACLQAGMVAVPTYPPADPRTRHRLLEIARDAEAAAVLTSAAILSKFQWVKLLIGSLRRMKWHALEELLTTAPAELPAPGEQDLALLQYTSGSTARPRGVMLSHGNVFANVRALEAPWRRLPARPEQVVIWLPLYHDMGLMTGVIFPLHIGASSTLMSPLYFLQQPRRWLQALSEKQGTLSAAPNFAYALCLKKISLEQAADFDLSHWRVTLNGAEVIQPEVLEAFSARFAPSRFAPTCFYNAYGLAESTVFVTGGEPLMLPRTPAFCPEALSRGQVKPDPAGKRLTGLGHPWADTRLRIVNPDTATVCAADQIGEIWLQGGSLGRGYWRNPAESAAVFGAQLADEPGLWLRSGDLGFVWEQDLFVTGRLKELVILQGQNHAPESIERAVQQANPIFRTGCGVAFSVGEAPERLVLVQEIRPDCTLSLSELTTLAREAVAAQEGLPLDTLQAVPAGSLPKTSSGKLQRRLTRSLYLNRKLKTWKPRKA
jgi:acyl-CoA synthetase (AMP-forming)/AMP-acid ligase II